MNSAAKLVQAMRENPQDWTMENLQTVAKKFGLEVHNNGVSHHIFSHPAVKDSLSVPERRPIKAIYIMKLIALVDQIQE